MTNFKNFLKDESGATAIEYGLLAGLISIVAIAVMTSGGQELLGIFTNVDAALTTANGT